MTKQGTRELLSFTFTHEEVGILTMALAEAQTAWTEGIDDDPDYDRTAEQIDLAGKLEVELIQGSRCR